MDPEPRLRVPGELATLIRGLHPELKRKVRAGLDAIRADLQTGKKLQEDLAGFRSLRIGRFRIIYGIPRVTSSSSWRSAPAGASTRRRSGACARAADAPGAALPHSASHTVSSCWLR
jgi:hypothetical protein